MLRIAGTGNDHNTLLQIPAQNDLRGGHTMGCGNRRDGFIPQQFTCVPASAQRIPALYDNTQILDKGNHLPAGR